MVEGGGVGIVAIFAHTSGGNGGGSAWLVGVDASAQLDQVGPGEGPVERSGGGVVVGFEGDEPGGEGVEIGEVAGLDDFALDHGEDDLDLVQPGGVHRQVHQGGVGQAAAMRATEVRPLWLEPLSTTQNTRRAEA